MSNAFSSFTHHIYITSPVTCFNFCHNFLSLFHSILRCMILIRIFYVVSSWLNKIYLCLLSLVEPLLYFLEIFGKYSAWKFFIRLLHYCRYQAPGVLVQYESEENETSKKPRQQQQRSGQFNRTPTKQFAAMQMEKKNKKKQRTVPRPSND